MARRREREKEGRRAEKEGAVTEGEYRGCIKSTILVPTLAQNAQITT